MTDIFEMLLDGISTSYELLDRIPIVNGVSVLDFLIAIVVISVIMPVLLTLVNSMRTNRNVRVERHGSDKKNSRDN